MLDFDKQFEQEAQRMIQKAQKLGNRPNKQYAYKAAFLTVYGFQVAIPVVLGIFLGLFLDKVWPVKHVSWVLNFILLGFLTGLFNANVWFYHMMEIHKKNKEKNKKKKALSKTKKAVKRGKK